MKFIGGISLLSICIVALSIYFALNGVEFDNGMLRFTKDSPENATTGLFSMRSPLKEDPRSKSEEIIPSSSLRYDYYRKSCPSAERIIRKTFKKIYDAKPSIAPSLIRLLFHDCFIGGCDASVLLDTDEGFQSEKDAIPNLSLKGFNVIDQLKNELEHVCPRTVSCSDILVLAARETTIVTGGPWYLLKTGRKDSVSAFKESAEQELPSPQATLSAILSSFALKGFNQREVVSLLGTHSVGITNCTFFENRIYNFSGTGKPDPQLNHLFIKELKTKCPATASALPASEYSTDNYDPRSENRSVGVIDLSFKTEGGKEGFGTRYYRRLLDKRGVMFSDQQLTSGEETEKWVRAYADDVKLFRRDFAKSIRKLSDSRVLTGPPGEVRKTCSKILPRN